MSKLGIVEVDNVDERLTINTGEEVHVLTFDQLSLLIKKSVNADSYFYGTDFTCPTCGRHLEYGVNVSVQHCKRCGQALDWSDYYPQSDKKYTLNSVDKSEVTFKQGR